MKLRGVNDDDLPDILPYYRGFTGITKVIDRRRRRKRLQTQVAKLQVATTENAEEGTPEVKVIALNNTGQVITTETEVDDDDADAYKEALNADEEEEIAEVAGSRPLLSMVSLGIFRMDMNGTIIITELPVGRWPLSYRKWLEQLVEDKKITGYRDCSVNNEVYFEIYGFYEPPNHRNLKLRRTMGMSNMVLLDEGGHPVRYDTAFDILEAFYSRRLPVYQRRKDYDLQRLTEEIAVMRHKINFIRAVISKEIRIINRKVVDIHAAMDRLNIPHEIYEGSKTRNLSEDDIQKFLEEIASKEQQRASLEQTTIEQMWLRDLAQLEEQYRRVYGIKPPVITLTIGPAKNAFPETAAVPKTLAMELNTIKPQPRQPAKPITINVAPAMRLVIDKSPINELLVNEPPVNEMLVTA